MKKTNIMFVLLQLDAGGSERVVFDLVKGLNRNKFNIYITAFNNGVLYPTFKRYCNEIYIVNKNNGFDFMAMLKVGKIIKVNNIDIVNAHHYMSLFYTFLGAKFFNNRRLVYTEHSVPEVELVTRSIHGTILFFLLFGINAVVGVSKAITEKFTERYPRHLEKFRAIPNGVDIQRFRFVEKRTEVRIGLGLKEGDFVVGMVANFRKIKNHACLVRAARLLKEERPHLQLLFVGAGSPDDPEFSEDDVRGMVRAFDLGDRVVFAGYQSDIPGFLSIFDAFCLPSFSEGLPVSILEAMSARVPIVASDVHGISEVVENRVTGLLFDSDDEESLAGALRAIMDDKMLVSKLVKNAWDFVNDRHSVEVFRSEYISMFRDISNEN